MKLILETSRLLLREVHESDAEAFFIMDSDPAVVRFVGIKPVESIENSREIIRFIQKQYADFGIARWSVVLKTTGECIGWAGLKRMLDSGVNNRPDFIDLGYRFQRRHWGKGYATEAARASLEYGFETLGFDEICSFADLDNFASQRVLEKIGMMRGERFLIYNPDLKNTADCVWFSAFRKRA